MSAVSICCSTNSWLSTPRSTLVAVGRNSRLMSSCVIFVTCSADHSCIISDSMITPAKNAPRLLRTLLRIFVFASELLRTTEPFHVNETRSALPNMSCREIVAGMYCFYRSCSISNLGVQRDYFLLKLCDNKLHRQRHSRIDNVGKHKQNPHQMRNQCFSCTSSDKQTVNLLLRLSTKSTSKLDSQTCSSNPSKFPSLVNQTSPWVSSQAQLSTTQPSTSNDQPTLRSPSAALP